MTDHDDRRQAVAYLSGLAGTADFELWKLLQQYGYIETADRVACGLEASVTPRSGSELDDGLRHLEQADRIGVRMLMPVDDEWPQGVLDALQVATVQSGVDRRAHELVPPVALWVKGTADLQTALLRAVSITGARASTSYGEHVAGELAYGLAQGSVTVVTGGAFGIDSAALRGSITARALPSRSPAVAVLAGGLDRPYPATNARLFDRVAGDGLLVSEYPPGFTPQRERFLARNRLIAAFGAATVVVEAARRSASLQTCRLARQLDRPVLAVPGPVTSATSTGCHDELRRAEKPARLVADAQDVLDAAGLGVGDAELAR